MKLPARVLFYYYDYYVSGKHLSIRCSKTVKNVPITTSAQEYVTLL